MKISLITICHKSKENIARYVTSFLKWHSAIKRQVEYEFIFVENSNQPELREIVHPLSESGFDVLVVDSKNEGFGIACNLGAKLSTGDLLVFVNPDMQFLNSLDPLAELSDDFLWGTVHQLTPRGKMYSIDLFPEKKNLLFALVWGHVLVNKYPRIFLKSCYVVGSFLVVKKNLFEMSGGFDPAFFLYYEETELCRRLQVIGGPPLIETRVSVIHEGLGSHETSEHALKYEAQGFLIYCRVTSQLHLIHTRMKQFRALGFFSKIARQRYLLLKKVVDENIF